MHRMIPGSSVIDAKEVHATIMLLLLLLRFTHPTSHGVFGGARRSARMSSRLHPGGLRLHARHSVPRHCRRHLESACEPSKKNTTMQREHSTRRIMPRGQPASFMPSPELKDSANGALAGHGEEKAKVRTCMTVL